MNKEQLIKQNKELSELVESMGQTNKALAAKVVEMQEALELAKSRLRVFGKSNGECDTQTVKAE